MTRAEHVWPFRLADCADPSLPGTDAAATGERRPLAREPTLEQPRMVDE